ncbi:putative hydro-lyase [Oleispirillum naphthae]|uniref:putative hydro-lyase n=1 Tax=Oleispirillum naphthae TaxID=2838853 RepID=UPI00308252AA
MTPGDSSSLRSMSAREVRARIRAGAVDAPTAGMADGFMQANLAILPREHAADFLAFCRANPKPCPLLGVSRAGEAGIPGVAEDLDIRTDLCGYRVYRDGRCTDRVSDIAALWRDDLVVFALGCSFSFEHALLHAGLAVRHIDCGCNVPMFKTAIPTMPRGRFSGPLVVSMRPFAPADAIRAICLSDRMPLAHGAPVHFGDPAAIGIADLQSPDYGDAVPVAAGEVPVFWACGVTPQAVLETARLPFAITHDPGHMLITDIRNADVYDLGGLVEDDSISF